MTRTSRASAASLILIGASVSLGAAGQILLKAGAERWSGRSLFQTLGPAVTDWRVLAGLAVYAVSSVLWLVVLSRVSLSVAYPFAAMGYVVVVAAAALRGEQVPALRWLGVAFIVLGVATIGMREAQRRGETEEPGA